MECVLRFGESETITVEIPEDALVGRAPAPVHPLDDPAAALAHALRQPLDYPPLRQAVAPGDQVATACRKGG